jgi:5'-deoxynucleotidase YfbR-like HD superfamily hydrolase
MNPFEIRARLLEQAQTYLTKQHELNTEFAKKTFDQLVAQGAKMKDDYQEYMPKMYTFEDVIKEATKLSGFVNAK